MLVANNYEKNGPTKTKLPLLDPQRLIQKMTKNIQQTQVNKENIVQALNLDVDCK
jgi:hypothetical protein